jgi:hypothetical protein
MKTLALIFSVVAVGFIFGCAKKDNTNTNPIYTMTYVNGISQCMDQNGNIVNQTLCNNGLNSQYQYVNGMCIYTPTGQQVNPQMCQQSMGNSGFQYVNGICVQTQTGQQYPPQYCQQQGGMGGGSQVCIGAYIYNGQYVTCQTNPYTGINNCRGYVLYSQQTGQQVQCM